MPFNNETNDKRVKKICYLMDLVLVSADSNKADTQEIKAMIAPLSKMLLEHGIAPTRWSEDQPDPAPRQPERKSPMWADIRQCAEQADLRDFPVAIAVFLNRLDEKVDQVKEGK